MATHFKGPVIVTGTGTSTSAGNQSIAGTLSVGGGTAISKIVRGTVAVNPASLATVTAADLSVTITGAVVGDTVIMNPPAAGLTAGLFCTDVWVSAADTVKMRFYNGSGGTIDEASASWNYCLIRS